MAGRFLARSATGSTNNRKAHELSSRSVDFPIIRTGDKNGNRMIPAFGERHQKVQTVPCCQDEWHMIIDRLIMVLRRRSKTGRCPNQFQIEPE